MLQLLGQVVHLINLVNLINFVGLISIYYYYPNNYLAFQELYCLRLREGLLSDPLLLLIIPRVVAYLIIVKVLNLRHVLRGFTSFFLKDTYVYRSRVIARSYTRD